MKDENGGSKVEMKISTRSIKSQSNDFLEIKVKNHWFLWQKEFFLALLIAHIADLKTSDSENKILMENLRDLHSWNTALD